MPDAATIAVPDLIGLTPVQAEAMLKTAGLAKGTEKTTSSTTIPAGGVTKADPDVGTLVNPGSVVNLEVSSGPAPAPAPPPTNVVVPDVIGFTKPSAEAILKNVGLEARVARTQPSDSVPARGVSCTDPEAGTLVTPGSTVELNISSGPESKWKQFIPTIPTFLFGFFGFILILLVGYIVTYGQGFLTKLADKEVARGLITFLIAITTVGVAIILAISTLVLTEGDAGDKRFDRGKQVLSILIGVLGTIVGFYFGSAVERERPPPLAIATTTLSPGQINTAYPPTTLQATGGVPPLKWSVKPALPAGLTLEVATGTISGTPTAALQAKKFTFTVTDSAKPAASATADIPLEIKREAPAGPPNP
jgi:hypothetical protein